MSLEQSIHRLLRVLRAENEALAAGDFAAATKLLPEKQTAAAMLQAAVPEALDPQLVASLRDLAAENAERLTRAIEVQGRILEMVAFAARVPETHAATYSERGCLPTNKGALAFTFQV